MIQTKFGYPTLERSQNGSVYSIVYYGGRDEIAELQSEHPIGEFSDFGILVSNAMKPVDGFHELELKYQANSDGSGIEPPDTAYGKRSAALSGSVLSLPIEKCVNYRACWNHYLMAAPNVNDLPSWWASAKTVVLSSDLSQKYQWCKNIGEAPASGKLRWHVLKDPVKPGVESIDYPTFTMTESARYQSFKAAVDMVGKRMNMIVTPFTSGVDASGGRTWKCDSASVQYTGKYWLASFSYTLSGPGGWDTDLYSE